MSTTTHKGGEKNTPKQTKFLNMYISTEILQWLVQKIDEGQVHISHKLVH